MNTNRILPSSSSFNAVVDGKLTGLAGCKRSAECERAPNCLRADDRLPYRSDMVPGGPVASCGVFILATAA